MYNYKLSESHDGSHFFVKTPTNAIIRISFFKADEDYENDYLEKNIRHLLLYKYTPDITLTFLESKTLCETIAHIVYEFLAYNKCVLKIEVKPNCGKNFQIKRYLENRPEDVKGFLKENLDDCVLYFLFNVNKIESTDLLYNLIEEFKD